MNMALLSWKEFKFFDVSHVRIPDGDGSVALNQGEVSCVAAGSKYIFAGTPDGTVHVLDQTFKSNRSWKAHETSSVTHIIQVPDTPYLLTLTEDLSHDPSLKVWALDQNEKTTGSPRCLYNKSVHPGRKVYPVTTFAATGDLAQVAVGFGNGVVTVVRGDFIHDRGTKQRIVFESEEPITGLEFREANTTGLYIATTERVLVLAISGKAQGTPARTLDEHGCAHGCMTLDTDSNELVIAREDAIYTFGPRGKGTSYQYQGDKKTVAIFNDYVAIVVSPASTDNPLATVGAFQSMKATAILTSGQFVILNPDLKLIAHLETPLSSQIRQILNIWGDLFLLTTDGKVYRYHEKSFQQKLESLYERNMYVLAINLAKKYKVDAVQQNVIFRKYGDYLYGKGDYDTAMQQYLSAIDNTEPSQIIRKFLDNQRIRNLIEYLEELHEHDRATSDHTTLLLNCYAKLKDIDKLEEFIKQPGELKFDLDTAIIMCRQGGYYDQAAFLARRHNEHGLVIDILVEDLKKYAEALAYIVRLEPKEAFPNFMKFGTVLLEHCPNDTTQLFIDYFTGHFTPKKDAVIVQERPASQEERRFGTMATSAAQNLAALIPLPYMSSSTAQSSPSRNGRSGTVSQAQVVESSTFSEFIEYEVPKPRIAFSAFVDHVDQFIVFLQACIESDGTKPENQADLHTAIFEMYLHKANTTAGAEKAEWEAKARQLIQEKDMSIDTSNVLLLSDLEKFRDGTILVSEKQGLCFDVFRSYTAARDTAGAIKALRKYGPEEPELYPAALAYFTSSAQILEEAGSEVEAVLKKIDEEGLMAPLQVIQTLSTNDVAKMGLIKDYLSQTVSREQEEIAANRRLISTYRTDRIQKQKDIEELQTKPISFSTTRCATCSGSLDLPAVHFLCKHSFHQRCLNIPEGQDVNDSAIECPICAPQNRIVRQTREMQEQSADNHELFLESLKRSDRDRFGEIGRWFSRGVMSAGAQRPKN